MNIDCLKVLKGFLKVAFVAVSLLALNACADSKVAIKLANSFDSPTEEKDAKGLEVKNNDEKLLAKKQPLKESVSKKLTNSSAKLSSPKKNKLKFNEIADAKKNKPSKYKKEVSQFSPQPYRIIIRLSGANPSAPAETVTRALRDAGVIFEVEKIERFEKKSSFNRKSSEGNQF